MITLSSVSEIEIANFRAWDYEHMYHMLKPVVTMETPFSIPSNNSNSKNILKNWVKELAEFRMTPNQIYKAKMLRKAYQYFIIFSCCLFPLSFDRAFTTPLSLIPLQITPVESEQQNTIKA